MTFERMIEPMERESAPGLIELDCPPVFDSSAPAVGWASGPLGAVQAADREIARQTAVRARAVAAFAASRPASADRAPGEPGAMRADRRAARPEPLRAVSEWATPELAIALNLTAQAAEALLERSLTLVHRLPGALAGLEAGLLHAGHLWHLLDKVAPIADDALRAAVEAELLAWIARRADRGTVSTPAQLGDKARRLVAARDAREAARRLARALRERGVYLRPERAEGMAAVSVVCTLPEARALHRALAAHADTLAGDPAMSAAAGSRWSTACWTWCCGPGSPRCRRCRCCSPWSPRSAPCSAATPRARSTARRCPPS